MKNFILKCWYRWCRRNMTELEKNNEYFEAWYKLENDKTNPELIRAMQHLIFCTPRTKPIKLHPEDVSGLPVPVSPSDEGKEDWINWMMEIPENHDYTKECDCEGCDPILTALHQLLVNLYQNKLEEARQNTQTINRCLATGCVIQNTKVFDVTLSAFEETQNKDQK